MSEGGVHLLSLVRTLYQYGHCVFGSISCLHSPALVSSAASGGGVGAVVVMVMAVVVAVLVAVLVAVVPPRVMIGCVTPSSSSSDEEESSSSLSVEFSGANPSKPPSNQLPTEAAIFRDKF